MLKMAVDLTLPADHSNAEWTYVKISAVSYNLHQLHYENMPMAIYCDISLLKKCQFSNEKE